MEDRHREVFTWHRRHPDSEVSMIGVIKILDDVLKLRHERRSQMAVHEQGPSTSTGVVVDTVFSLFVLASSQRDGFVLSAHVHLLSESEEISNRV